MQTNQKPPTTYKGDQYDDIEKLMDDAEKLVSNPNTRKEGRDLMALAELRIKRECNRMLYAKLTGQMPNIPPLEPASNPRRLHLNA
jgi:hypothetical protein